MSSHSRSKITFHDLRHLLAPIQLRKKYCHTFAFLARVWACEESYVRNLQLSARKISEERFEQVRVEVDRILKEEFIPRESDFPNSTTLPI